MNAAWRPVPSSITMRDRHAPDKALTVPVLFVWHQRQSCGRGLRSAQTHCFPDGIFSSKRYAKPDAAQVNAVEPVRIGGQLDAMSITLVYEQNCCAIKCLDNQPCAQSSLRRLCYTTTDILTRDCAFNAAPASGLAGSPPFTRCIR